MTCRCRVILYFGFESKLSHSPFIVRVTITNTVTLTKRNIFQKIAFSMKRRRGGGVLSGRAGFQDIGRYKHRPMLFYLFFSTTTVISSAWEKP
jgi:hypothetical protein